MRWIVCSLLILSGCDGGGAAADAGWAGDCDLGGASLQARGPGGEYQAMPPAEEVELVLGFQGFKYVYLRGRADRRPPASSGSVVIELDGRPARSQPFGDLGWTDDGAGGVITAPLRVFFNDDPLPDLVDRPCTFTLLAGDASCRADATGSATLRYDAACYEGPDGTRVCPDAGAP